MSIGTHTLRRAAALTSLFILTMNLGCNGFFTDPTLSTLNVGPAATINEGGTQQMSAVGIYSNGNRKDLTGLVTWSASPQNTLTIDKAGLVTGGSPGAGTVTASYQTLTATADITVDIGNATALAITPNSTTVNAGASANFTAAVTISTGGTQDVTATATWSSDTTGVTIAAQNTNPIVVDVASTVAAGTTATITASYVSGSNTLKATTKVLVQQ